jgi:hypothetical protein
VLYLYDFTTVRLPLGPGFVVHSNCKAGTAYTRPILLSRNRKGCMDGNMFIIRGGQIKERRKK